jgi:hypothetical protein
MPPTNSRLQQQRRQQKTTVQDPQKSNRGFHQTKIAKGPIFGKGPDVLRAALSDATETARPGPKPNSGPMAIATLPEWYVFWALTVRLKKEQGVDFSYRSETGYNQGLSGSTQLDFEMHDGSGIAMEIQGDFFHYQQGTAKIVIDQVRAGYLSSQWTVINLDEDDVLRDPEYYVREALEGRDHSYRYTNTFVKPFRLLQ